MTDDKSADSRVFTWTSGSEVKPERVDWEERGLLPRGCLTVAAGRGNSGKSTTCAAWAAPVTQRGETVAWLHSEESRSMHIVPKMHAAGADLDKIKFLDVGVQMSDGTISEASLQLPRDIDRLEEGLVDMGCRFVVFDALTSFKSSKMSANSGDDVRAFLEPIQRMAERLNAVVIGIAHLGKDAERKARDSVKGASEWTDVPRQVLAFHREDGETDGVISDVKGNLSPSPRSIGYSFENIALPEYGIDEVGRVVFTGDVDTSVDEARRSSAPDDDAGDRKESEIWLEDYLTENGEVESTVAKRDGAKALGVSAKTISRAAAAIKVKMTPRGFPRKTFWSLATIIDGEVISGDSQDNKDTPVASNVSSLVPTERDQGERNVPTGVPTGEIPSEDKPQNSVPTEPTVVTEDGDEIPERVYNDVVDELYELAVQAGDIKPDPRPTTCSRCFIALPTSATTDVCDDCGDPARKPLKPPVDRPLYVVHDGKSEREDARLCPHCGEALLYADDQRDGYHTSVRACVQAHKRGA